jgi:hypothetical protein
MASQLRDLSSKKWQNLQIVDKLLKNNWFSNNFLTKRITFCLKFVLWEFAYSILLMIVIKKAVL